MRLINTIEIRPYDFAKIEYDYPRVSSKEFPDEWYQFWKRCISDMNLERLEPIRKGGHLVDIETINDAELTVILMNELKDVEFPDFDGQIGSMIGGIALLQDDLIYLEPTCCGDIGGIIEWEGIFKNDLSKWKQLWIGHPWVHYRQVNGLIEFSNYTESNPEANPDYEVLIGVSVLELQIEVEKMRRQQECFELRVRKTLETMEVAEADQISRIMTGLGK